MTWIPVTITVHIEIKDGAARFVDSPCPDHICEGFGWLSNEDQTATCLRPCGADHRACCLSLAQKEMVL